jgi:hypothetical protein
MDLKMGSDEISNVGIEGERIGVASKWLGSPSMESLDMLSLNYIRLKVSCGTESLNFSQNQHQKDHPHKEF